MRPGVNEPRQDQPRGCALLRGPGDEAEVVLALELHARPALLLDLRKSTWYPKSIQTKVNTHQILKTFTTNLKLYKTEEVTERDLPTFTH